MKKTSPFLIVIFGFSLLTRFLYFPENVYFGFDQARDAFESQNIFKNLDLKIIGPPTAGEGLFHGPLYWYLLGPLYLLGKGNPLFPAAFLLFLNALGVFLIFLTGKKLFNEKAGLISSFIYAVSFEQTQYAMYFGNPGPAVLTIILFYLGLSLFLFKGKWWGIPLSLLGFGLSIQFEFFLLYLFLAFVFLLFLLGRKNLDKLKLKEIFISAMALIIPLFTFILAELKFGFRTVKTLLRIFGFSGAYDFKKALLVLGKRLVLTINDNLYSFGVAFEALLLILLVGFSLYIIWKKFADSKKIGFLLTWFLASNLIFVFGIPNLYYANIGTSAGFILLASYYLSKVFEKSKVSAYLLLSVVFVSNVVLITRQNPKGIINDIYVQEGMLLTRLKSAVDFIYQESGGKPMVVSASTMPLYINTTWAYLFNWYGSQKYGRLPYWAGKTAEGYPGGLPFWKSQEKDYAFFSIIEPTRGVEQRFIDEFLMEQKQYGEVLKEEVYGDLWYSQLVVQKRSPK
ncbi:MAG: glycosyltransferase family 39 protein [Patescibacteria group bacterium]